MTMVIKNINIILDKELEKYNTNHIIMNQGFDFWLPLHDEINLDLKIEITNFIVHEQEN